MNSALLAALKAALSGGVTGGAIGGAGKFLLGSEKAGAKMASTMPEIGSAALKGAGLGSAIAGGSQLAGSAIMGAPEEGEEGSPYAKRGALGGGVLGGATGGVLGAMLAHGKLPLAGGGMLAKAASRIGQEIPDNIAIQYLKRLGQAPTTEKTIVGGMLGAGLLGAPSAFEGADEGQSLDTIQNEIRAQQRRKMAQRMAEQQMLEMEGGGDVGF